MNPLQQLESCGQSPWLDDLHRDLVRKGELERLIREDGLKGLTSNPSIFEKAIGETDEYKDKLEELLGKGELDDMRVYESLAAEDIQGATDLFRPVYEASGKNDGFVSLEVSPYLAHDTEKTVTEAKRLWEMVKRENMMVKIPGTREGIPAIRRTIASGINVNVTLLFGINEYAAVVEAYMSGLEDLVKSGGDASKVASVASFFLSRIDTAVEKQLETKPDADAALVTKVIDKVAIACAKLAYQKYLELYSTPRWQALAAKGAKPQRLLWASTSTKKKTLPDTYYVDGLVGDHTVNTMPPATLKAFREHGKAGKDAILSDLPQARDTIAALHSLGLSLDAITDELVKDGVTKFSAAFDTLLGGVAKKRRELAHRQDQSEPSLKSNRAVA